MISLSQRSQIAPFQVMEVMQAAQQRSVSGLDVVHMEVGQPANGAPQKVIDFVQQKMQQDKMGYTVAFGLDPLRQALANYYQTQHKCEIDPSRIAVTTGSSGGFMLTFLAAFNAGDRVAIARPGYPAYRNILKALGCEVVEIEVTPEEHYQINVDNLAKYHSRETPIKGVIIASPANPTGMMMSFSEMQMLYQFCNQNAITLISDEIYHGISFENKPHSIAEIGPDAFVLNSFSKYYAMTGWRVGWLVMPEKAIPAIERLCQNMFISAPAISQWAALAALSCRQELDERVAGYRKNRDLLCQGLTNLGYTDYLKPEGAFYLYLNVSALQEESKILCHNLLHDKGIALTSGWDFDPVQGGAHIRFSFAGSEQDISSTLKALQESW